MNCEKVKAQLSAYIDSEVAGKDAFFISEHIAICTDCSYEEQLLRKTSELLKHWENVPAPDGFCEALLARAENVSPQLRRRAVRLLAGPRAIVKVVACGLAILLLCAGVIFFSMPSLKRSPVVEPLPIPFAGFSPQRIDDTIQEPRYTTMAEMKVAGVWK